MNNSLIKAVLNDLIIAKNITKKQLAQNSGISRATLYNVLQGNVSEARLSTLIKIAAALDAHPIELLTPYFNENISDRKLSATTKTLDTGFITDVTYPDNSSVFPDQFFVKTWSVINTGKTAWEDYFLKCLDIDDDTLPENAFLTGNAVREKLGVSNCLIPEFCKIKIPYTKPGERISLSVKFRAPNTLCRVISEWKCVDNNDKMIFPQRQPLSCLVKVVAIY
ncbi:MAG: DNA-binding Xre family transcriptional regulator [Oceanospirillaceae bacterium]|jgi:DNA-binding Xre family transcriptional regulator